MKNLTNKFILIEGIDGSGKSTFAELLFNFLKDKQVPARKFNEPSSYETGLYIRRFLKGEIKLEREEQLEAFIKDREESVEKNILPSLKRGETVVLDRYYYSTAAYQGKDIEDAKRILKKNQKLFPAPDYILFLSISPKKALQRITERNPEKEIFESLPKLQLIDSIFRKTLPESSIYLDSENLLSEALLKEFIARM